MKHKIIELKPSDYEKCGNIRDMQRHSDLEAQLYQRLLTGNQTTFVYTVDSAFVGEISLVRETDDPDYTIPGRRIYVSRLIVKDTYRRQGIGRQLLGHAAENISRSAPTRTAPIWSARGSNRGSPSPSKQAFVSCRSAWIWTITPPSDYMCRQALTGFCSPERTHTDGI